MVDVNAEVKNLLEAGLGETPVRFQYPDSFNDLPVVTYYTLTQRGDFAYDNTVIDRKSTIVIDIWADYPKQCADLSAEINKIMTDGDWYHEFEADVPNTDNSGKSKGAVKHRTMRFAKIFEI